MATRKRRSIPLDTRTLVLHEAGYKCGNPACRTVLTLDIHHLDYVAEGGTALPYNLLALCPNCHSLHHNGHIPRSSLRTWKLLLLSLNEAFDRHSVDVLLTLDQLDGVMVWGDGLLDCAALVASGLISVHERSREIKKRSGLLGPYTEEETEKYWLMLSPKGRQFVAAWKLGDQNAAILNLPSSNSALSPGAPTSGTPIS